MLFSTLSKTLLFAMAWHSGARAATSDDKTKKPAADPCTIASTTGSFFDLRPLSVLPVPKGTKPSKNQKTESWHAKGYDYKSNFTLNICAPVVETLDDVEGVDKSHWKNVSAFYQVGSKQFSLGQQSSDLTLRGRRLVLQYLNGSPCGKGKRRDKLASRSFLKDDDDDDDDDYDRDDEDDDDEHSGSDGIRRKSATISFHCDKDPLATGAIASYAGVDPDECAYFFEVLSPAACAGSGPAKQGVGPAAVFAIIGVIAILVYFLGGVVYQRNVTHARGWRQLPNYSMWSGIWGFIKDIFIICTSSCARLLPRRRGYSALSISANGNSSARGRHRADDENRLIDQLDEEWDD